MDFEFAANRLKKDHADLRNRAKRRPQGLASTKATMEAKKRQEYRRKQAEKKKQKERVEKLKLDHVRRGFDIVEQRLGVMRSLTDKESSTSSSNAGNGVIFLEATSVHGQGDKITLPSSLLSTLANRDLLRSSQERGQPLFFRLGIRRPNYVFPASQQMKLFMNEFVVKEPHHFDNQSSDIVSHIHGDGIHGGGNNDEYHDAYADEEDDDQISQEKWEQAYLEELAHEYISYVYATVIEFTQDEGYIGLPQSMAAALLQPKLQSTPTDGELLESKVTVDPASVSASISASVSASISAPMDIDMDIDDGKDSLNKAEEQMQTDSNNNNDNDRDDNLESKTPGHPAYGLFPIPKHKIEVTLLTHLPLGKKCTLQPTKPAIQNGFYNLKNVKLALEQSLIRTRGCLNVNDVVHCWHRGKKFNLCVKDVTPSHVGAVSCVNTDVEVDIAAVDNDKKNDNSDGINSASSTELQSQSPKSKPGQSTGYRLSDDISQTPPTSNDPNSSSSSISVRHFYEELKSTELQGEPALDQTENIITVQIRGDQGKQCRRRFDMTSSQVGDLFAFAVHEKVIDCVSDSISDGFKLVTRFPRRVFTLESDGETLLVNASLSKQELFMIEKM